MLETYVYYIYLLCSTVTIVNKIATRDTENGVRPLIYIWSMRKGPNKALNKIEVYAIVKRSLNLECNMRLFRKYAVVESVEGEERT